MAILHGFCRILTGQGKKESIVVTYPESIRTGKSRAVGDFVEMSLEKDVNVPISARNRLFSLLDKLCTQYDRRLDDDEPVLLGQDDQLSEAINKTRSRALKSLIDFYWVRRQLEDRIRLKFLPSLKSE